MMFPETPKQGEVFEHPNGHVYEYDLQTRSWNKTFPFETMTNVPNNERRTRKRSSALKEPSPTIEIIPISKEVDNVIS